MNIQKLLSGNDDKSKPQGKVADETKLDVKELCKHWRYSYLKKFEQDYPVPPAEVKLMRMLYTEYGKEKALKTIDYYLNNYEAISYIKGWPTIRALIGFRKSLVMEALKGPRRLDGQQGEVDEYNMDGYFDD